MKIVNKVSESVFIQLLINLFLYTFYAALLGISLVPSALLIILAYRSFLAEILSSSGGINFIPVLLFCLITGGCLFIFLISAIIIMGIAIRVLSFGIKEGTYKAPDFTLLRWLVYSGIYNIMITLILPIIPMSFFSTLFFKIIGCKIGKNVWINTFMLNDAYLLTIEDNVIIGGQTDVSCHLYENNRLILKRIHIGSNSSIGAHCYIAPGVTVGKNCVIGLGCYIRQGKNIPDNSKITSISNVSMETARKIEKGLI